MTTQTIQIGAFEAKTRLSELLDLVTRGTSFTITKHHRPVARLVAADDEDVLVARRKEAGRVIKELSKHCRLDGLKIRDLINEGRA